VTSAVHQHGNHRVIASADHAEDTQVSANGELGNTLKLASQVMAVQQRIVQIRRRPV